MMAAIAWRSLGRNRRRSILTAGAIGFSVLLTVFAWSAQVGQFGMMVDQAARLSSGHIQLQAPPYLANPRLRDTVGNVTALLARLRADPGVDGVLPRAMSFALLSHGERSFGAQVIGVDPQAELRSSTMPGFVGGPGRYLRDTNGAEAVIGGALAQNLNLKLGDELVVLGTGKEGGVAALVLAVVGIMHSGSAEIDRSLVFIPIDTFRAAFELGDEASVIAVMAKDTVASDALLPRLRALLPASVAVRGWRELMPEIEQLMRMKVAGTMLMMGMLGLMVTFSIVNTFIMTIFERTREMGMLMAIGMTPGRVQRMLQLESMLLCGAGVLGGGVLAMVLVTWLHRVGIPLPQSAETALAQFQMPTRLYPKFDWVSLVWPCVLMFVATQIAAFLPSLRIRRLQPVEALRAI